MTIKTDEQIIGKMARIVAVFKGVTRSTSKMLGKNSSQFRNYAMLLKCRKKPSGVYEMQETLGSRGSTRTPLGELTVRSPDPIAGGEVLTLCHFKHL